MGRFAMLAIVTSACSYTAPSNPLDPMPDTAVGPDSMPSDSPIAPPDTSSPDGPALPVTTDHVSAADTWMHSGIPDSSFSGDQVVIPDGSPIAVALMRFDLSGLAGTVVTAAELHIFTGNDPGAQVRAFVVNEAWTESTATWNQRSSGVAWAAAGANPPSRETTAIATFTPNQTFSEFTVAFDLAAVQKWIDDPAANFGIAITSVNADGPRLLSREATNGKPFLRITHVP